MIWTVLYNKQFVSESAASTKFDAIADVAIRHPDKEDMMLWNAIPKPVKLKRHSNQLKLRLCH
jgi:hypothetical protein